MYRRILTVTLITFGVLAAGGAAFAVANSVSTKPQPAFISHLDKSITDHPTPNSVDDHGNHDATPSSVDDHGNHTATPSTVDDHGHGRTTSTPVSVEDHGDDTIATTPVTIDDRGPDGTGRGADGSGAESHHSSGADDSSGSNHG